MQYTESDAFISISYRKPNETSKASVRYIKFKCKTCRNIVEHVYSPSRYTEECRHCKISSSSLEFINKVINIHRDTYDYSKVSYKNATSKVIIMCKEHGEFLQRPSDHLDGNGCSKCGSIRTGLSVTCDEDAWSSKLYTKHGDNISYVRKESKYIGIFNCKVHGQFSKPFYKISTLKYFCPTCAKLALKSASSSIDLYKDTILYYVYYHDYNMYKLGITTRDIKTRLGNDKYTVIWSVVDVHHIIANLEFIIHRKYLHYKYVGKPILAKKGDTELYTYNIIPNIQELNNIAYSLCGINFKGDE